MRFGRQAQAVRRSEQCPAAGLEHAGCVAEHGLGVSNMLDDVAAVDRPECVVRKRHRFALATHQADIAQASFVKPLASQHEPPHGDIQTDETLWRNAPGKSDQAAACSATQVEDRSRGRRFLSESIDRPRLRAGENMPHLPPDVGRSKFRAMTQVISFEHFGKCHILGRFVQVSCDFGVTIVTAVRVGRRP